MILSVPNDNHSVWHEKVSDIRLWRLDFVLQYLPSLMQSSANISQILDKATTVELCLEAGLIKTSSARSTIEPCPPNQD